MIKVHDDNNLVHRVLVEAGLLVLRAGAELGIELETRVAVQGVETRDANGKLLVASSFGTPEASIALRDDAGALLWDELRGDLRSTRELEGVGTLTTLDGAPLGVSSLVLDGELDDVVFLADVAGTERLLPVSQVVRSPEGEWGVLFEAEGLAQLAPFDGEGAR